MICIFFSCFALFCVYFSRSKMNKVLLALITELVQKFFVIISSLLFHSLYILSMYFRFFICFNTFIKCQMSICLLYVCFYYSEVVVSQSHKVFTCWMSIFSSIRLHNGYVLQTIVFFFVVSTVKMKNGKKICVDMYWFSNDTTQVVEWLILF